MNKEKIPLEVLKENSSVKYFEREKIEGGEAINTKYHNGTMLGAIRDILFSYGAEMLTLFPWVTSFKIGDRVDKSVLYWCGITFNNVFIPGDDKESMNKFHTDCYNKGFLSKRELEDSLIEKSTLGCLSTRIYTQRKDWENLPIVTDLKKFYEVKTPEQLEELVKEIAENK